MRSEDHLDISTQDLIKVFKTWGWRHDAEGVKEVRLRHPEHGRITVRKTKSFVSAGPAIVAAEKEHISVATWLEGPKTGDPDIAALPYDAEELDWFKNTDVLTLMDPEQKRKYRAMRSLMSSKGVLDKVMGREPGPIEHNCHFIGKPAACPICHTLKEPEVVTTAAEQREQLSKDQEARGRMDEPIQPLPVETDQEGWITLQKALSMMNTLKVGDGRANTLCEMIALLSVGNVEDEKGAAVRKVLSLIPGGNKGEESIGYSGVALNIQKMKKAGLVWTAPDNGARTKQIGLCMPVKLSAMEIDKYLYEPPPPGPSDEQRAEEAVRRGQALAAEAEPEEPDMPIVTETGGPPLVSDKTDIAVQVLEERRDDLLRQAAQLTHAIEILQENHATDH